MLAFFLMVFGYLMLLLADCCHDIDLAITLIVPVLLFFFPLACIFAIVGLRRKRQRAWNIAALVLAGAPLVLIVASFICGTIAELFSEPLPAPHVAPVEPAAQTEIPSF